MNWAEWISQPHELCGLPQEGGQGWGTFFLQLELQWKVLPLPFSFLQTLPDPW